MNSPYTSAVAHHDDESRRLHDEERKKEDEDDSDKDGGDGDGGAPASRGFFSGLYNSGFTDCGFLVAPLPLGVPMGTFFPVDLK